ncbi:hypothetical protein HMPREF9336_03393 [Segniliparus rugosus ATCC BAA-974]|uniref:Uncharacterized protein n=2 Tax=Segniliparus rugosus TaxID=286804 RepID=E5XV71_SEGRC|nr:hypothetical protein HMPREF9336_03393 [Segniliparus rugosus ATCC BAA-974]
MLSPILAAVIAGLCAAPARAQTDTAEFCRDAFEEASASKRVVEGMINALNEAVERVDETTEADRDATIQRARTGIHGLREAAAQQLRDSADTIETDEPAGLSDDWQDLADQLVQAQRNLSDTILYKSYDELKPAVTDLNQKSIAFFSQCDTENPSDSRTGSDD